MREVHIKGFILIRLFRLLKQNLSQGDYAEFEQKLGLGLSDLRFLRDYPATVQVAIEERLAQRLYGHCDDSVFYRFGRDNFDEFAHSAIGRMTLALTGRDPLRMVRMSVRVMGAAMSGMDIEIIDQGPKSFVFHFRNNPYRPLGWQGVIEGALEYAGVTPDIAIVDHGGGWTEYLVSF